MRGMSVSRCAGCPLVDARDVISHIIYKSVNMMISGTSRNVYPIPHGPIQEYIFVHEQNTLVESRFTVNNPKVSHKTAITAVWLLVGPWQCHWLGPGNATDTEIHDTETEIHDTEIHDSEVPGSEVPGSEVPGSEVPGSGEG